MQTGLQNQSGSGQHRNSVPKFRPQDYGPRTTGPQANSPVGPHSVIPILHHSNLSLPRDVAAACLALTQVALAQIQPRQPIKKIRMTNDVRNPNLGASDLFRISSFVIRIFFGRCSPQPTVNRPSQNKSGKTTRGALPPLPTIFSAECGMNLVWQFPGSLTVKQPVVTRRDVGAEPTLGAMLKTPNSNIQTPENH